MILAVHPHHQAGTPFWARWYRAERDAGRRQTPVGDALLLLAESRAVGAGAGLAAMHEKVKTPKEPKPPKAPKVPVVREPKPDGYVNPGILRMREINRQRREAKNAGISL